MGIWEQLSQYITQYSFVRNALIVCPLIALCSSLLGVTLVLKRFSFIGDGLSHVAFGAMAVASVLNLTKDMPLVLAITFDGKRDNIDFIFQICYITICD